MKPWLHEPPRHSRYGSCPAAVSETSGRSRTLSFGMPVTRDCQDGLGKPVNVPPVPASPELAPPLPAERFALAPQAVVLQLSFQTSSGMYESAVSVTGAADPQYLLS